MVAACEGLRVIDLSRGRAAGIATMILADFGADVLKIEPLASASIAQVHAATLPDGREVVVKVVRPDMETRLADSFETALRLADVATSSSRCSGSSWSWPGRPSSCCCPGIRGRSSRSPSASWPRW